MKSTFLGDWGQSFQIDATPEHARMNDDIEDIYGSNLLGMPLE